MGIFAPALTDVRRLPICDDPEFPKETAYCGVLRTPPLRLRVARSCGLYEDELVRAVLLVKHERIESLGKWFARQHAPVVQLEKDRMAVDVVIPLPLHAQRARERGFNQVDVFGRPLARLLGLPFKPVLLVRSRPRPEKHLLRNEERWETVRGAFAMRKGGRVDNLRILLLDDVMTTGATLDAFSRAPRETGAKSVMGLTIARAGQPVSSFVDTR